jgi:hypothetical protein
VDHVEWFDQAALYVDNPAKGKFDDSLETRKEENGL